MIWRVVKLLSRNYNETEVIGGMGQVVIFDFGGVIAEEGFRKGLKAIARANGLDEMVFFESARDLIYQTGYVTGTGDEHGYWEAVRQRFGITETDEILREQVLKRFVLRPEMLSFASDLRGSGHTTALLTDQTDWLYRLDRESGMTILSQFQFIFNSYELHMSKREKSLFYHVESTLKAAPGYILFIDDNPDNIEMAVQAGWRTILFQDCERLKDEFLSQLQMTKGSDPLMR
jgi:putative hydrolase of the HAD superfamily